MKLWREMWFWRRRQESGVTSEEYSIPLIQPQPDDGKIFNQGGKVPQACSYTVEMPQKQPGERQLQFKTVTAEKGLRGIVVRRMGK